VIADLFRGAESARKQLCLDDVRVYLTALNESSAGATPNSAEERVGVHVEEVLEGSDSVVTNRIGTYPDESQCFAHGPLLQHLNAAHS
jgi:hypothetical protein